MGYREYGGYIELEQFRGEEYHKGCLALNCGRSALAYLIERKGIQDILVPYFLCDSVCQVCEKYGVKVRHYHISHDFMPECDSLLPGEYLYIVNYYGQLQDKEIEGFIKKFNGRIILDNVQAFFKEPPRNVDAIYGCRKFFGVADGAYLYTNEAGGGTACRRVV